MILKRSNSIEVNLLGESAGIRVLPFNLKREHRPANTIYGGRLLRKDMERTAMASGCVQATDTVVELIDTLTAEYRQILGAM